MTFRTAAQAVSIKAVLLDSRRLLTIFREVDGGGFSFAAHPWDDDHGADANGGGGPAEPPTRIGYGGRPGDDDPREDDEISNLFEDEEPEENLPFKILLNQRCIISQVVKPGLA